MLKAMKSTADQRRGGDMKVISSWIEPGTKQARRGNRLFLIKYPQGDEHIFTGEKLAKIHGKSWKALYEQGRRKGLTDPSILVVKRTSTFNGGVL